MLQVQYDQPCWNQAAAYYTAKKLDGSTAISDTIQVGYPMFRDLTTKAIPLYGASTSTQTKTARGITVTQCEDGASGDNRHYFAGIVSRVDPNLSGAGYLWLHTNGTQVPTRIGSDIALDPPTWLAGKTGKWFLVAEAGAVTSGLSMLSSVHRVCAKPATAFSIASSDSPTLMNCDVGALLGGIGGN